MKKVHSDRYSRIEDGVCNPYDGWDRSTTRHSKVTCGLCRRALIKEGLLPPGPTVMVSLPSDQLQKLRKDLAEARAWKRNALETLRRL